MPDVAELGVVGLDELLHKLDQKKYMGALKATLWGAAELIRGAVATYPPETEANQPREPNTVFSISTGRPINRWYIRGRGTVTTSGRVYYTSEDLGHSWTVNVQGLTAEIGSGVSYGPYVQGSDQVSYHKARGWKTIHQALQEQQKAIVNLFHGAIERVLG